MPKPNYAELIFVLDRSGSMERTREAMEKGFDKLIEDQKKVPGECKVSLTRFDDQYEVVYEGLILDKVPALELVPRGFTALLDAVGKTIVVTGERLKKMREEDRPSQVLFVIITDGAENASKEYTIAQIREMIVHQRTNYQWEFIFLGANIDSVSVANAYGIRSGNAVNYQATNVGTQAVSSSVSASIGMYRSAGSPQMMTGYFDQAKYDAALQKAKEDGKKLREKLAKKLGEKLAEKKGKLP